MLKNINHHTIPNNYERFIREAECKKISGLSRTRRWELERSGKFPKRIQLSERAIAWRLSDLMSWIEERTNETK